MQLHKSLLESLRCPTCRGKLQQQTDTIHCTSCSSTYPVRDGVPILLDENTSVFKLADYENPEANTKEPKPSLFRRLRAMLPSLSMNFNSRRNFTRFADELRKRSPQSRVLVLGGRILGDGMDVLVDQPGVELIETDLCIGPRVQMICDAHRVPFADNTFDAVIIQAVLEHVCAPQDCVAEIYRVLKPSGLVYAETPFMQQVHGGAYDFTRFTDLGHRLLFRRFEQIDRGACCGPGMALAWTIQYFLLSFSGTKIMRALVRVSTELSLFWLKYLDLLLINRPEAQNAASGFYLMGSKTDQTLSDRELITLWRGAV